MSDTEDRDIEGEEEEEPTAKESEVFSKYKTAGDIVNKAIKKVISEIAAGKKIVDLCDVGDKLINDQLATVYTKAKLEKGVAFPTCLSVNNCVGHYSPLADDTAVLADGDVVKIDLGAHIDGFVATAAQTVVVGAGAGNPIIDRKADVIIAAQQAADAAHRLLKIGRKNQEITDAIQKIADSYKVNPVEGVLSHQMKKFVIDGNNTIINKSTLEQKVDEVTFAEYEVYAIDIVMSTGEGKPKETESRTTIYKRALEQNYLLKMKASRFVFTEINQRFPTFPFTVRAFDDKRARLGMAEIIKHDLVHPYPVLYEKPGEFVAQVKFTGIIAPSTTHKITGTFDALPATSTNTVQDTQLRGLLNLPSLNPNKKKGEKKETEKKEGATEAAPAAAKKDDTPAAAPMNVTTS